MEDFELKNIWKEYDRKIEEAKIINMQSWVINFKTFEYLQTEKAKSKLNSISAFKKWVIFGGILWIAFLVFLIVNSLAMSKIFFVLSLSAIVVFNVIAVIVYLKHIILISEIDNSENLVEVQQKTAQLQASTMQITRILFLQSPFYSTFFWSPAMISSSWTAFFLISLPITLLFVFLSFWLYKNINYKNADKKWFRILFSSKEWTSIIKAIKFMEEIEEFKKESM
jgi:hypothetical protein